MSRHDGHPACGTAPLVLWAANNIPNEAALRQDLLDHGYAIAISESGVGLLEHLLHHLCSFLIIAPPISDMDLALLFAEVHNICPRLNICLIDKGHVCSGDVPSGLRLTRLAAPITAEALIRTMTRLEATSPVSAESPASTEWVTQLTLPPLTCLSQWSSMCDGLTAFLRAFSEHIPLATQGLLWTGDDPGTCSIRSYLPAGDTQLHTCYQSLIKRYQDICGQTDELPCPEYFPFSDAVARNTNDMFGRTVTIPIILRHEIKGMLALVQSGERTLTASETFTLHLAIHQLVYAYDAWQQATRLAHRDGLTGCLTHERILESMAVACRHVKRYGTPMAVVLLDLDHFKVVNDTYGHQVGDAALVHIAEVLRTTARESDTIGRYGGDEFVIILPQATASDATAFATRLLKAVRRQPLHIADTPLPLTASVGIAALPTDVPLEPAALIARADDALYAAKRAGGNNAQVWSPVPGS